MENIYKIYAKFKKEPAKVCNDILLQPLFYVFIASACYVLRAFEYIAHPQLYAEDGAVWLADGFNIGPKSVLLPLNGLLHFPERLFGFLVAQLPLNIAPFLFNISAFVLFAIMVYYIFSPRTQILKTNYERFYVLLSLCLIANIDEFFFNFSNSIFLLGIIGLLILIAKKDTNKLVSYLEKSIFLLTCFTLPFCWFFTLVALYERIILKKKQTFFLVASISGSIAQLFYYLTSHAQRSPVTFISLFSKYTVLEVYNQIAIPALRFARIDKGLGVISNLSIIIILVVLLTCTIAGAYVFLRSNKERKFLLFFLLALTFASLKSPIMSSGSAVDALRFMSIASGGDRYFVFGIIGLSIIFATTLNTILKSYYRYVYLFLFFIISIYSSLNYHSFFVNKEFTDYSDEYKRGISQINLLYQHDIQIPVNPGHGWKIQLTKKGTPNPNY